MKLFGRFCMVGGIGFLADTAVLFALVHAGMPAVPAKALSFGVAVLVTFEFNRRWAFGEARRGPVLATFVTYLSVQTTGFVLNWLIFAVGQAMVPDGPQKLLICAVLASAGALILNFLGSRRFVFRIPPLGRA